MKTLHLLLLGIAKAFKSFCSPTCSLILGIIQLLKFSASLTYEIVSHGSDLYSSLIFRDVIFSYDY